MKIIMSWQKICPKCKNYMEPVIFANPIFDPKKEGNPWQCDTCFELYGCHDGRTYAQHIEMIKKYY